MNSDAERGDGDSRSEHDFLAECAACGRRYVATITEVGAAASGTLLGDGESSEGSDEDADTA